MSAAASRSIFVGPKQSAAARGGVIVFMHRSLNLSSQIIVTRSDNNYYNTIFMHFNAKRCHFFLIAPHSQCDWPIHNISQILMVDDEIYSTLFYSAELSESKMHCTNSSQLLTYLEFLALWFVAILQIRL